INREQRAKIPAGQLPYEDWTYNILREARARDITSEQFNTRVQAGLTFKFMDGVKFTSSIQYEYNKSQSRDLQREDSFYTRNLINTWIDYTHDKDDPSKSKRNKQLVPKGAILKNQRSTGENYVWRNQLDFDRTFGGKHQVAAAAGFEMQEYKTNSQRDPWIFGHNPDKNSTGYINLNPSSPQEKDIKGTVPYYTFGSAGSGILLTPSLGYRLDRYVSVYGNASYTFAGKYSVTGSARSDASNLIADDASYRWAPLWSVGGKWNVSQENFMQPTASWLDRLSLRLTYGFNGNVEKSTSHKTLVGRSTTPSATFGGLYIGTVTMGNPDLRWEKTSSINAAIDFALLNNTVFGSIDFYSKRGKDIIGNKALPSVLGATALRINNAEISNKGVEIEIGVNTKLYEEVRFTGKLTYAYNDNKITNLYDPNIYAYSMFEGAYVEGYPVGALWGYNYLGMENGVPYVEGIGGLPSTMNDVAIHNRALGSLFLKYAGPSIAPHTLGLHAGFSGYGFSLSVFINGTFGGHFRNPTFDYNMVGASKVIIPYFVNEVIKGSKKLPSWPAPSETKAYLWNRYVPNLLTMVEKSSFIKVKEINLEYSLPKQWTDFVGTGNVRVFAQVRDLGCLWVANSRGYDPEWLPGTMKPATTYAFGVNLNF
ncbi:MAG: SusC/RagA family TonB-linked outer membrane protein, partial [Prevotellaceae bacterium]|nr:SusC/RagA family TonB-linked outer membrane protein [Prevotellaceae bacterium]